MCGREEVSIYLWLYSLVDLGRIFCFLIYTQSEGLLGRGISPSQGRYLHTGQHKHRINAHRHPCLEWDSNPRPQCSCFNRAATVISRSGCIAPAILNLVTRWGEWPASRSCQFFPGQGGAISCWIRGWVGPRSRRKRDFSLPEIETRFLRHPVRNKVSMSTELSRL
jgi:hypothetical protein